MTSKSTKRPWNISAADFGRQLTGMSINLLVQNIERSKQFQEDILGAKSIYWNEDFAVMEMNGHQWMLHADHTYSDNQYLGIVQGQDARGTGIELQLYQTDPDAIEAKARENDDAIILNGAMNKPHGLRECYIIDPDGYCWVVSRPLKDEELV